MIMQVGAHKLAGYLFVCPAAGYIFALCIAASFHAPSLCTIVANARLQLANIMQAGWIILAQVEM